jgi:hypothetical protein
MNNGTSLPKAELNTPVNAVEGFSSLDDPWPAGLPSGCCWTGTGLGSYPGVSWVVNAYGGGVDVNIDHQSNDYRAACVP